MNAVQFYRVSRWMHQNKIPLMPKMIRNFIFLLFNSYIPPTAEIGENTLFAYGAIGVVLHSDCKVGAGCVLGQGITIGASEGYFSTEINKSPTIGDNCYIAAGAKILGDITIGNNCIIGAGAVVLNNVPDNSIVVGAPAKVIKSTPDDYLAIRT